MKSLARSAPVVSLVMVLSSFACSDGGGGTNEPVIIAQVTIDASGGVLEAPDQSVSLRVPPGAVQQATNLSLRATAAPAGAVGPGAYEIRPAGVSFAVPAVVTLSYKDEDLGGKNPADLRVASYNTVARNWEPLSGHVLSQATRQLSGSTQSIAVGAYARVFVAASSGTDGGIRPGAGGADGLGGAAPAGGATSIGGTTSLGGSPGTGGRLPVGGTGPGGTSGGGGIPVAGAPGSGGSPVDAAPAPMCYDDGAAGPAPPYPSCSTSPVCSAFPGTVVQSCTDTANGYFAKCCEPPP